MSKVYSNGTDKVSAIQYTGNNLKEVIEFTGKHPRFDEWFPTWEDYETYVKKHDNLFKIYKNNDQYFYVAPSEWILLTETGWWSMADSQFTASFSEV